MRSGDSAAGAADDKVAYQAAFGMLKDGQYDRAIAAFQKFLVAYPASSLAENAQYWLGEAYYVNKAFPDAQSAFQRVIDKYPQSRKRPDALLKIGYCQYELKQWEPGQGNARRRWPRSLPILLPAIWPSSVSTRWRRRQH